MNNNQIFRRQLDIVKPSELNFPILIVGAGGIGSWTTLVLAKMGCSGITVVDKDIVEPKNIPSQFYTLEQVKEMKVKALTENVEKFTNVKIFGSDLWFQEYIGLFPPPKLIIITVDSLAKRRRIWETMMTTWLNQDNIEAYIDARMGGDTLRITTVNMFDKNSREYYVKYLLDGKKKESDESCTARSVIYNTFLCGGIIANIVKKYAKRESTKRDVVVDMTRMSML